MLTVDQIREKFNIQKNAYQTQIESARGTASRKIRQWVGETVYAEAIGGEPVGSEAILRYETVRDAHAFLTMYYLAVSVGNKLTNDGFLKQAQDAASVEGARVITNQYLTPSEIAANKADYYNAAEEIAAPYVVIAASTVEKVKTVKVPIKFVW